MIKTITATTTITTITAMVHLWNTTVVTPMWLLLQTRHQHQHLKQFLTSFAHGVETR